MSSMMTKVNFSTDMSLIQQLKLTFDRVDSDETKNTVAVQCCVCTEPFIQLVH